MRNRSTLTTLFSSLVLLAFSGLCFGQVPTYAVASIGDADIRFPIVANLKRPTGKATILYRLAQMATPDDLRLVDLLVSDAAIGGAEVGVNRMDKYLIIQTIKAGESRLLSASEFTATKKQFEANMQESLEAAKILAKDAADRVAKSHGNATTGPVALSINQIQEMRNYISNERSSAFLSIVVSKVQVGNQQIDRLTASSTLITIVRGKLLWLQTLSTYNSPEDLNWVKDTSIAWLNSVQSLNPS